MRMCLIRISSTRFIDDLKFRAAQELSYFRDTYNKAIVLESIQKLIIVDWAFNVGACTTRDLGPFAQKGFPRSRPSNPQIGSLLFLVSSF